MRLIDVSEYSLKGAEIHWIEHDYHTINVHRKPLYEIPTVDAVPVKHGKWIPNEIHGHKIKVINGIPNGSCICDVCGQWLVGSNEYDVYGNYCPACGAKMDLEEQDAKEET